MGRTVNVIEVVYFVIIAENLYNREVLVISVDFIEGQHVYEDIAKQLAHLDIGILGMIP